MRWLASFERVHVRLQLKSECLRPWLPPTRERALAHKRHRISSSATDSIPHYAGLKLDRAGSLRKDPTRLQELVESADPQIVLLHEDKGLLSRLSGNAEDSQTFRWQACALPLSSVPHNSIDQRVGKIFLGLDDLGRPFFATAVTDAGAEAVAKQPPCTEAEWVNLRREGGPHLPPHDAALMAYAAGMVHWARKNAYSAVTGQFVLPVQSGHARAAEGERPFFTRIDPAVIMAVTSAEWILLGRQARWSSGRFSLLAGFCEIGETLEQAVVRETREEAGVAVSLPSVRYQRSQPWPFPQSLMIGFTAEVAASQQQASPLLEGVAAEIAEQKGITVEEVRKVLGTAPAPPEPDDKELESAYWFHYSFVAGALKGRLPLGVTFTIPGPHALANTIITDWVREAEETRCPLDWPGKHVPDVEIDVGTFKYVLLRISGRGNSGTKLAVRGDRQMAYHADILDAAREKLEPLGLQVDVLGGGRIENSVQQITVFGYSSAFRAAPHELTAALIRRMYPMASITAHYQGY